jgi:hypothetical protein
MELAPVHQTRINGKWQSNEVGTQNGHLASKQDANTSPTQRHSRNIHGNEWREIRSLEQVSYAHKGFEFRHVCKKHHTDV